MLREHPVRVFGKPAAGNVRHSLHFGLGKEPQDRLDVDPRWLEQCRAERLRAVAGYLLCEIGLARREDAPYQGETVGMRAA